MIEVLFFGRMADVAGIRRTAVDGPTALFALRDQVFAAALTDGRVVANNIRMSVNRVLVTRDQPVADGDEVAFFSVFSGG